MDEVPDFKDVFGALQSKAAKWELIGIALNLSADELAIIRADSIGVEQCLIGALTKWSRRAHPPPTWKVVIEALKTRQVGEAALAKKLEKRFASRDPPLGNEENETSVAVACRNLVKIKETFAKLLKDVAVKLKTKELDFEAFHFFIIALFPPGKCIPQSENVIKIFEAVTQNGLWSYWHYTPVENIIKEYAPSDNEMKSWVDNYRKDLSGYKATTKIADAMEIYSNSIEEFEETDQTRKPAVTCDSAYLRQLSVKLRTRVTEKTLVYIDDLWLSLAEYFLLPSLSVLLDKIQRGCVEVSWLIPPHYVFQIVGNLQENAAFLQSKGIVKVFLDGECVYDGAQEEEFRQSLVNAVSVGDIDEMLALLTSGIDVNMILKDGDTLLMVATYKKQYEVLSLLVCYGADVNKQNKGGWTALMLACELANLKAVELLLEHNTSIEIKTWDGWTAVMIACESGNLNVVRLLVEKHANICVKNKKGHTCLMAACHNSPEVVEFLLSLPQVDVNARDEKGFNALMHSSGCGNIEIFQSLLKHPKVDINATSNDGSTALMFVCHQGHVKCVELLLSQHADSNIRDENGATVLTFSCMSGSVEMVKLILSYEMDPNTQDDAGWTPLMFASSKNFLEIVQELLNSGADSNIKNKEEQTCLMAACHNGHLEVVQFLLSLPQVDINAKDMKGINALMHASHSGNIGIFESLLKHPKMDINATSNDGCTALMLVCKKGHVKCAELLLSQHADTNVRDENGATALTFSCMSGSVEMVKLIFSYEMDPNTQDDVGWTPLMFASFMNFLEIVQELLNSGANPNIKNKEGKTALKIALENRFHGVIELLKDCTQVEVSIPPAAITRTDSKGDKHPIQLGSVGREYRAGLENISIFREILERGPESLDAPKPHSHRSPWQQHQHGHNFPEPPVSDGFGGVPRVTDGSFLQGSAAHSHIPAHWKLWSSRSGESKGLQRGRECSYSGSGLCNEEQPDKVFGEERGFRQSGTVELQLQQR